MQKISKIDKLARKKKELILKREKLLRDMRERNSKRDTKIHILENAGATDYENTNKKVIEMNRQIEKVVRDITSEQIYVNDVANAEKKEHEKELKNE